MQQVFNAKQTVFAPFDFNALVSSKPVTGYFVTVLFLSSPQQHNSLGEGKAVSWLQSGNAEELASVEKVEKLQKFIFQQNNSPQAV